jgi:hypothetical protein
MRNFNRSLMSTLALLAAVSFVPTQAPEPEQVMGVAMGTHAPKAVGLAWRTTTKESWTASAFPVGIRVDLDQWLFLTCKHASDKFTNTMAIVENLDRSRKLLVVKVEPHPTLDLAVVYVKSDGKPVPLVKLALKVEHQVGLSVFSVGYPRPRQLLSIRRGYLSGDCPMGGLMSASVEFGMSGGPVLLPDGRAIGISKGFFLDPGTQDRLTEQAIYVPLNSAGLAKWLGDRGIK